MLEVSGKRPARRDEAHGVLTARCGTGEATEEVAEAKREESGGEGLEESGDFPEVFGLRRPGGGPDDEAMPGAKAQQASREKGCVCIRGEKIAEGVGGEERTQSGKR